MHLDLAEEEDEAATDQEEGMATDEEGSDASDTESEASDEAGGAVPMDPSLCAALQDPEDALVSILQLCRDTYTHCDKLCICWSIL